MRWKCRLLYVRIISSVYTNQYNYFSQLIIYFLLFIFTFFQSKMHVSNWNCADMPKKSPIVIQYRSGSCVCVCVYKWEEADLFVCPLCSPLHGSFLTRNSSRAIQPPPTLTITVLRKILTKRSCWESPNWGRWHKNGGKKGQKEWKQKRESGEKN